MQIHHAACGGMACSYVHPAARTCFACNVKKGYKCTNDDLAEYRMEAMQVRKAIYLDARARGAQPQNWCKQLVSLCNLKQGNLALEEDRHRIKPHIFCTS